MRVVAWVYLQKRMMKALWKGLQYWHLYWNTIACILLENLPVRDGEETNGGEADSDIQDEVSSQASSLSEDYIIVLPECFDTSRPLGESMYSSALSQSNLENVTMAPANPEESHTPVNSTSDILITSQTLDEVSLTPQTVEPQPIRYHINQE